MSLKDFEITPNEGLKYLDPETCNESFTFQGIEYNTMFLYQNLLKLDTIKFNSRLNNLEQSANLAANIYTGTFSKNFKVDGFPVGGSTVLYQASYSIDLGNVGDPWVIVFFPVYKEQIPNHKHRDAGVFWFKGKPKLHCDFDSSNNLRYPDLTLDLNVSQLGDKYNAQLNFRSEYGAPAHAMMVDGILYYYVVLGKEAPV